MDNNSKKIKGFFLILAPLAVVFAIQLAVSFIGGIIFNIVIMAYDKAHGIEWTIDSATGQILNLYTDQQYGLFLAIVTVITEIAMLAVGIIWFVNMKKNEVSFRKVMSPGLIIGALGLGIGIQGVVSLLLTVIYNVYPPSWTASYDELMESMLNPNSPMMVISVAILAPIAEELFFRGITMNYGRRFFPVWAVVIVQAISFGILHLNPVQSTYATLIGLMLGLVAVEYNSVWPGIFVHIGVNASAEILSLLQIEIPLPVMAIGGAVICGILLLIHFLMKNKKKYLDK